MMTGAIGRATASLIRVATAIEIVRVQEAVKDRVSRIEIVRTATGKTLLT